jgi:dihydrofolate reductase
MGIARAWVSMSLDGFITGPKDDHENPMGINGELLHDWMFSSDRDAVEQDSTNQMFTATGAIVMGRRMFDLGISPWGNQNPFAFPVFVATHRPREPFESPDKPPMTFVESFAAAVAAARKAAGEADILIVGGASAIQQGLAEGVIDELHLAIVPILLGSGRSLFSPGELCGMKFELTQTLPTPAATHLILHPQR